MRAPVVALNFAARRAHVTPLGAVLLLLGASAAIGSYAEYRLLQERRAGLELKLAAETRRHRPDPSLDARAAGFAQVAGHTVAELGTPWTKLLAELEGAARDAAGKVALLSVEPDHEKHTVHVTGESGDLPLALAYIARLQASTLLRYPMLDSHELKTDDAQRPVRFALTAEWRESL